MARLYFDNHATTQTDPQVVDAMLPYFTEKFGNPESAQHSFGWEAHLAIELARGAFSQLINAKPRDVVFTSGATESIALAILGLLENERPKRHIISCVTEHKATLETLERAKKLGHEVTLLGVNEAGEISLEELRNAIRENTALVSLMHGNNEIGTLHPIEEIGRITREKNVVFHVDAAQTLGKHEIDVEKMSIDLLSVSAHKLHGPKGVGALYVRHSPQRVHLASIYGGGGQEHGIRGGTMNVPGIVGFAKACTLAKEKFPHESEQLTELRDFLISGLESLPVKVKINGSRTHRLCNNVNVTLYGVDADRILLDLKDVAFSSASACSSAGKSHVLQTLGIEQNDLFIVTMRFGLSRFNYEAEVDELLRMLKLITENAAGKSST